jgi:hypothetical protein
VNKHLKLDIAYAVNLLARLRAAVRDASAREAALTRDFSGRRSQIQRRHREAVHGADEKQAAAREAAEKAAQEEEERVKAVHEGRRARIERIKRDSLRVIQEQARQQRERWQGQLQMKHFEAERALPANLKAVDAAFADYARRLTERGEALKTQAAEARQAFAGYTTFIQQLDLPPPEEKPAGEDPSTSPAPEEPGDHEALLAALDEKLGALDEKLAAFGKLPVPRFFSVAPPFAFGVLALVAGAAVALILGADVPGMVVGAGVVVAVLAIAAVLHVLGRNQGAGLAGEIAGTWKEGHALYDLCRAGATANHQAGRRKLQREYERTCHELDQQWARADEIEIEFARDARARAERRVPRANERNARQLAPRLGRVRAALRERLSRIAAEAAEKKRLSEEQSARELAALDAEESAAWKDLEAFWQREVPPIYSELESINAASDLVFPGWSEALVEGWAPSAEFLPAAKVGRIELDLAEGAGALPKDARLALPGPAVVAIPLALVFPERGSLLIESNESGDPKAMATINHLILSLLANTPPGKIAFTIIDPVGLGEPFAGFMHLSDYEESIINRKIWTQRDQIEERLAELNEHIEKVIQMYLRTEFATITEYNAEAGSVAEKYHFLVVADFPASFGETAAHRLQSIIASGPRCGVFTLVHWDRRHPAPEGILIDELRQRSVALRKEGEAFSLAGHPLENGMRLVLDQPPDAELAARLIHLVGQRSVDSNRVEVPFSQVAPPRAAWWTLDTTGEVRVAIGRSGATKLQYLAIGKGTRQHALFAGKTGSGKSTLFHVIITNLALCCSPEQVEFYLIDFKKGVEFKCYATHRLPHARVVAIESDREFALSVLQRVDEELKRRGDIFRRMGVQDLPGYQRAGGAEPIPRTLLIIDEFQEFFVEDDAVAQNASLLFDRIVRQGRAFGIHVLLGSQTLGGAYTLARATLGQMVIRVALQCSEADAHLIMDENNSAPRLLSRPGEGIYNDASGTVEGNSPFQVVWLGDDERDQWLARLHEFAKERRAHYPSPIVFEGNAPADIEENDVFAAALGTAPASAPHAGRCWLGAPNSIKGPTEAIFQRQSGNHLLMVGQQDETLLGLMGLSIIGLAAQHPAGSARFVLIHGSAPGSPEEKFVGDIAAVVPSGLTISRGHDLAGLMGGLARDLKARAAGEATEAPAVFVFVHGLQRFKKLKDEDEFSFSPSDDEGGGSPGAHFNELIREGSAHGIHLIVAVDTFNNVNRYLTRKALAEFEMRLVFQMSANDSASLIDSPRASNLGLHRALLYNEQAGTLETFRPYAIPPAAWLKKAADALASRSAAPALPGAGGGPV